MGSRAGWLAISGKNLDQKKEGKNGLVVNKLVDRVESRERKQTNKWLKDLNISK